MGGGEVVVPGVSGWLVKNPADRDELLNVLTELLARPEIARERGLAGKQLLQEQYTHAAFARRCQAALRPVLQPTG